MKLYTHDTTHTCKLTLWIYLEPLTIVHYKETVPVALV